MRKFALSSLILIAGLLVGYGSAVLPSVPNQAEAAVTGGVVDWAFTRAGQHPEQKLEDVIGSAKKNLDIAIYSLTKPDIVEAIKQAKQRGVAVRIITDEGEAQNRTQQDVLNTLKNAGIPIKVDTHSGLMHLKVTIADKSVVTTGSYNYSTAASTTNDEVLVVIRNSTIANAWDEQFDQMWNDSKNFKVW
ncbi:phospholipase D family nuclease [Kyrpidia tusciae]|uniref:phospholipase D n=1 Tax=Kyrpidia tusciae (strain DSM 2912 / NBRC 15312 / T2) TaxID=562970 RepID=D5WRV0_KYRT2|nr:phospholipase D family protein [Kyrpidia tusciae]ADG06902.1 Phosphatidylserine/phosphatidylglycerophosphate/ cardiolipinsynthase-like protein [Kyrpidia tusciae DSM 2912]